MTSEQFNLLKDLSRLSSRVAGYIRLGQRRYFGVIGLYIASIASTFSFLFPSRHVRVSGVAMRSAAGWVRVDRQPSLAAHLGCILHGVPSAYISPDDADELENKCEILNPNSSKSFSILLGGNSKLIVREECDDSPRVTIFARERRSIRSVKRHLNGLRGAEASFYGGAITAPRVHEFAKASRCWVLIQDRIEGICGSDLEAAPDLLWSSCGRVILQLQSAKSVRDIDEEACRWLRCLLSDVSNSLQQIVGASEFDCIEGYLEAWMSSGQAQCSPIHGDLALNNVIFQAGDRVGLIDWEWYSVSAPALVDEAHLITSTLAQERSISMGRAFASLFEASALSGIEERLIQVVLNTCNIKTQILTPYFLIAWLTLVYRSHVVTGPQSKKWIDENIILPDLVARRTILNECL